MEFWKTWWGSGDKYFKEGSGWVFSVDPQGSMPKEAVYQVCSLLDLLNESTGKLLVRDAYPVMLKRMQNAYNRNDIHGAVITGQLGIGASPLFPSPFP